MAGETPLTIVGTMVADPDLRFTPAGQPVANFNVASNPRVYNKQTNEWEDGQALFMRCNVWRQQAENVAESLHKGDQVIVVGNLKQRQFTDREGNNRTSIELEAETVGVSLKFATAPPRKTQRSNGQAPPQQSQWPQQQPGQWGNGQGQPQQQQQGQYQPQGQYQQQPPQQPQRQYVPDPWATGPPAGSPDEPPFAHTTGWDLAIMRGESIV